MIKIESGNDFSTPLKGNYSLLIWRNVPTTQRLKKIGQTMIKKESGYKAFTDGQPNGRTLNAIFNGVYNIIPHTF